MPGWKPIAVLLCAAGLSAQPPAAEPVRREIRSMMVGYRTALNLTHAAEPAKKQAAALMTEAIELLQAGRMGEARRRLSHGMALIRQQPWTAKEEFAASLALRTPAAIFDPARPLTVELGQVYPCDYPFRNQRRLRLVLRQQRGPARELGTYSGLAYDLIDEPFLTAPRVEGLPDGPYLLRAEILDGDTLVGAAAAPVEAAAGLDRIRAEAERRMAETPGFENLKASIRYPFQYADLVNTGRRELVRGMNFSSELARSRELLDALPAKKDPLTGAKGDLKRHYYLEAANEILPYRLYVPAAYDGTRAFPLIVALHGLGGNEDTMLARDGGLMRTLAEKHGYIVAAPLGYRPNGGYGRTGGSGAYVLPGQQRMVELSEKDVMAVLALVRKEYRVDPRRVYLMGHSMGGGGTWTLGIKYAETWAALAPIASGMMPDGMDLARIRSKPVLICHGDKDATANPEGSRAMAAKLRELGGKPVHLEVPGKDHGTIVAAVMPKIFEFFDAQR